MDNPLDEDTLAALVPDLLALCREAGQAISAVYHAPGADAFEAKDDDSPLTSADLASHRILCAGLPELLRDTPVLSEESLPADVSERFGWHRYWLVDPLDGTKEFLARTGEFTINIALIEQHIPVLGVLYQPLADLAHVGIPGLWAKAFRAVEGGGWQAGSLQARELSQGDALTVLASRRHRGPRLERCIDWLASNWGGVERVNSGSALKFCQMAEGQGDFYPRFSPCSEWDTAAGQAVLEAAGGQVVDLHGEPLRYNTRESLLSPDFLAFADPGHPLWAALIERGFSRD